MRMAALCASLVTASIRGQMQYRLNFLIDVGFGLVYQGVGFLFIWIVVGQFEALGGWGLAEITLLYGMRLTSHGLWVVSFSRMYAIDRIVRQGEWDRFLLRPMPVVAQLMFTQLRIASLGDLLGGVVLLTAALAQIEVDWTPAKVALLVAAVIGGAMLDGAFQMGPASLTFRTLESRSFRFLFDDMFNLFGGYPTSIFRPVPKAILTWVVPIAWVAWVPATVILDRTDELPFPAWVAWCSPLLGVAAISVAAWLFLRESRHYQSSGS